MRATHRRAALVVAVVAAALLAWTALAGADAPAGTPAAFPTTTPAAKPSGIVAGPDGNLWFTEMAPGGNFHVGSVTPSGIVHEVSLGSDPPRGAIISAAGSLWFPDQINGQGQLDRLTPPGTLTPVITHLPPFLGGVAADAAGDIWIASPVTHDLREVKPPYTSATPVAVPHNNSPQSLATGADGTTIWMTEPLADQVAALAAGTVHEFPIGVSGTLGEIVLGPDGNLYAGVSGSPAHVLQITPAGAITAFALPAGATADPGVLAVGPDGELWMEGGGMLTSMTIAGVFTDYPGILPAGDTFAGITADPNADALWLTDQSASTIYRVTLQPPAPPPPPTTTTTTTSTSTAAAPPPPPPLTAALSPVAAVTKTSVMLVGTLSEPAGSAATPASYQFVYGTTTAYGQQTPSASTTVTASGATVTASLTGLAAFTTYHYRLLASDCSDSTCQAQSPDESFTTGSMLKPAQGVDVGAAPISGTITVKLPGHAGFTTLKAGELIPLGATLDARRGTVLVESATGAGEVASGQFSKGVFSLAQAKGASDTTLKLSSNYARCPRAGPRKAPLAHAAAAPKPRKGGKPNSSHKVVNQVFGNAHGQFKTRGHYATAADEGTSWRTTDRCDGTLVTVTAGKVRVTDRVRRRTVTVTAGHRYLVRKRG